MANGCSIDVLRSGMCDADELTEACRGQYTALNQCVGNAFSCDVSAGSFPYCVSYRNTANVAELTCASLGGAVVASCTDSSVGRCARSIAGGEAITSYSHPLPSGFTAEALASSCTSTGGTWIAP